MTNPDIERFMNKFKEVEVMLRALTHLDERETFTRVYFELGKSNLLVKKYEKEIRELINLRNYYSHNPLQENVMMLPTEHAIQILEHLLEKLCNDRKLSEVFKHPVVRCNIHASLGEVMDIMKAHDYSQLPVYDERGYVGLMSVDLLGKWLVNYHKTLRDLTTLKLSELLQMGMSESVVFIDKNQRLSDLLTQYEALRGSKRFKAFIVTENGKSSEAPLNIITHSDINEAYRLLT